MRRHDRRRLVLPRYGARSGTNKPGTDYADLPAGDADVTRPDPGSLTWALYPRAVLLISPATLAFLFDICRGAGNSRLNTVSCSENNTSAERVWLMSSVPAPADPGWDEDPAWPDQDPMTAAEREAWLDRLCAQDDDPSDEPQEYWDPESCAPPPGQDELTAGELAGVREAAAD